MTLEVFSFIKIPLGKDNVSSTPLEKATSLSIFFMLVACGSGGATPAPKTPWEPSLAEYFDDSVDFTVNPQSLSGHWLIKYQEQLKVRLTKSEHILAVGVVSVTKKSATEGRECKDIFASIKAEVKGKWNKDNVTLRVCDNQAGFDSFREEDSRLFERTFIAFLKLYRSQDNSVGIHWHLSPLSQGLKDGMNAIRNESREKKKATESKKYIYDTQKRR